MAKDAAYKCRTQHTLIMVMCWDHNKSDLRLDTRACGSSPLGSGGCNGPQTQAVIFFNGVLLVSIRHTQNKTHKDSDVIEGGVWSPGGGAEEADWPQTCKFTPLKTDRSWFMGVCIPPRAPARAAGVWFMSLWGYKSEFVCVFGFTAIHTICRTVSRQGPQQRHQMCNLYQGKVARRDGKSLRPTSRNLVDDVEMTSEKEIIELKGKLGPFLHHAILLFSIWGLKNTFLLFAFEYRV